MTEINKEELRRLAEGATAGPWKECGHNRGGCSCGLVWSRHSDVAVAEAWRGDLEAPEPTEGAKANAAYIAAANPATVLALLDENKRIASRLCACRDCGGQGEIYSGHNAYKGHFQPPEPVMDVCGTCGGDGVLGSLEDFETLTAERDALRAELEALRKDAERWRFVRSPLGTGSPYAVWHEGRMPIFSAIADACIDEAMAKEGGA